MLRFQTKMKLQGYSAQLNVVRQALKELAQMQGFYRQQLQFFLGSFRRTLDEKGKAILRRVSPLD